MPSYPVVSLSRVSFIRNNNTILHDVSLRICRGEHWAIIGPNGSGKTSLISIINGYHRPSEGEAEVLGKRFGSADLRELRRSIGECSSEIRNMVHNWEPIRDIVLSGRFASIGLYEPPSAEDCTRADGLLELFGLSGMRDRPFRELSDGEQQKTLLARALMPAPSLLVLDEPCAGLDLRAREELLDAVQKMGTAPDGPTLIYITHHIEEIMPAITHALALRKGNVVAQGKREDMLTGEVLSRTFDVHIDVQERDGRLWPIILKSEKNTGTSRR
ncbi:MAG: ABC transporter ATP-binding protein [Candidatus Methanoperedens sp.]|nr:ABC transporter ATP-binding protein [Candidatus Methanoperedens sp.]